MLREDLPDQRTADVVCHVLAEYAKTHIYSMQVNADINDNNLSYHDTPYSA